MLVGSMGLHVLRRATHVHQYVWQSGMSSHLSNRRVNGAGTDVIDHVGARINGCLSYFCIESIHGQKQGWMFLANGRQQRNHPIAFLLRRNARTARSGALSTQIEDPGSLTNLFFCK